MKRRNFMQWGIGLGTVMAAGGASLAASTKNAGSLEWRSRTFNAMGTTMVFKAAHADADRVERALDASVADIRRIEDQMSLFRPDSALSELNRTGVLHRPPADLLAVLQTAQQVSRRSGGAFDVTVQPLWQTFDAAQKQGRLPTIPEIAAARKRVGWRAVDVSTDAIRLTRPGMGITLNGIAQGYAADKVKARFQFMQIDHALIDAGEWASLGQPAHTGDWTLGIADPRDAQRLLTGMAMQGACVATSADDQCAFSPDFAHHHIFDPQTGASPTELSSVTVLAPSGVLADALTKVFFMAGYDRALPLARSWKVDVLVVDKLGRWQASPGVALRRS